MMEPPPPVREQAPPDSETKSMIIGLVAIVGIELIASVQLSCLVFELVFIGMEALLGPAWFGLFVPAVLLYCASHVRLFGRGVGLVIAALVANLGGLTSLIMSAFLRDERSYDEFTIRDRLMIPGYFFTTLAIGIVRTTSRSFLIVTIPPEKQGFVSTLASIATSVVTALHMFIVHGAVFGSMDSEAFYREDRFAICEGVFAAIGCVMTGALFVDRRTLTDAPLALALDRGGDDEPIFKLAKPFMFAISAYFLVQTLAPVEFRTGTNLSMAFRAIGVFQVGALVGAAPFILKAFQGKGGLLLLQIVAAVFIAGMVLAESVASLTAMYAFGGLGLGALQAAMFTFLGQTVTRDNTPDGVGMFVSFGLIAQAIAFGLSAYLIDPYEGGAVNYAGLIAVATLMMLRLPISTGRDTPQP